MTLLKIASLYLAVGCLLLLAQPPPATVPDTVARITKIDIDQRGEASVEYEVTGDKAINAIVIERMTDHGVVWKNFPLNPLARGGKDSRPVWAGTPITDLRIAAVIFTDGTSLGYVKPYTNQPDTVTYLLDMRKGEADAWTRWANFAKSLKDKDDRAAVSEFVKATKDVEVSHQNDGGEATGESLVLQEVQQHAVNLEQEARDAGTLDAMRKVREDLLSNLNEQAQRATSVLPRRAK